MAALPDSDACALGICDGSGFLVDEERGVADVCECQKRRVNGRRVRTRGEYPELPKRFRGVSFDRPPVTEIEPGVVRQVQRYVRDLDAHLDAGRGLWFEGGNGTGKTTLASLVCKAAIDAGRSVAVFSAPALLNEIKRTFNDDSEDSYNDVLDRLIAVDLLHLDDLGAERTSPWVLEQLYAVINARYEEERAIIVTTNLSTEELIEQVTPRTVSRIEEMCEPIALFGEDQRTQESRMRNALRRSQVGSSAS